MLTFFIEVLVTCFFKLNFGYEMHDNEVNTMHVTQWPNMESATAVLHNYYYTIILKSYRVDNFLTLLFIMPPFIAYTTLRYCWTSTFSLSEDLHSEYLPLAEIKDLNWVLHSLMIESFQYNCCCPLNYSNIKKSKSFLSVGNSLSLELWLFHLQMILAAIMNILCTNWFKWSLIFVVF